MAITQTQTSNHVRNVAVGRYIDSGTAAAFTITTGFKPRYVKVVNVDSGDMTEWYEGMAAASAAKTLGSTGVRSKITSLGTTVSASGFTVGLDTDINVTSEQISWVAMG
jgi:hypothetical protein